MSSEDPDQPHRVVYTHGYLRVAADELTRKAERDEQSTSSCIMALIASAFYLEASLNHVGDRVHEHWELLERKLDPIAKLKLLASHLRISPDWSSRPYQTVALLMRARNALAHGKTEVVPIEVTWFTELNVNIKDRRWHWDTFCKPDNARRCFDDVVSVVEQLCTAGSVEHYESACFGVRLGSGHHREEGRSSRSPPTLDLPVNAGTG